ncbi:NEDD8-activating enzyme E1 regulatory subunit-like protein [Emericellopsis cladophorae]|uniref:NEDD8-activating enzyme E1 regulatory subunit n=1 Tax=Emericellopsis cladophorae TaxID=2686198 RepID=A0A9P9Y383_9HYPO|nr:NEDD8-activating enzyme E1 regulatory subunit-like protein [Emericellopsis cladophorae]KAI6782709.1 NEDD8-activating enzyme E1 regulatory subunit-like protein [Emericellopsis cladophorae]
MVDVMEQTPPLLHGLSEKERKYDRQLRLWAASGQSALESANILLVNSGCGTVGVETLKNLVLPGIGKFTIADEAKVSDEDLGVNFFLDEGCKGKSRAQCCAEFLTELNPEVRGDWWPREKHSSSFEELLASPEPFTAILYSAPISEERLQMLETYASQFQTPLIAVQSAGFYGYFQVKLPGAFPIVDTHPDDTAIDDLRVLAPWPELEDFARNMTKNIENLDEHDHGHLPMVVLLLHYLEEWRKSHEGANPINLKDKTEFRKGLEAAMRKTNADGGEENYEEAVSGVMRHVQPPALPSTLRQVFDYQRRGTDADSSFWLIAAAVKKFHEKHGTLPVSGGLPDMKAQSDVYIRLQNLYKTKARQDAREVLATVQNMEGGADVESAEVELFCTNARFIKLINGADVAPKTLVQVTEQELANDEMAAVVGPEMPYSLIGIYLALTATTHLESASEEDIESSITSHVPIAAGKERILKAAKEVARAGGVELHNTSAVLGGMVAQEMIKIITKQYIPVDNTCIFDGIDSRCQVLRL